MSVVVLSLLLVTALVAVGLLVKMHLDDAPLLGGLAICLLVGPGTLLAFLHVGLTG